MTTELVLLALTLVAIWRAGHLHEWHHAYLGALVWVAGWWLGPWVALAGIAITADDCAQHWCEWLPPSPLHWVFVRLANRIPLLAKLAAWLDGLFRKPTISG